LEGDNSNQAGFEFAPDFITVETDEQGSVLPEVQNENQ
jgi:hypothetical protein